MHAVIVAVIFTKVCAYYYSCEPNSRGIMYIRPGQRIQKRLLAILISYMMLDLFICLMVDIIMLLWLVALIVTTFVAVAK